VISDFGFRIADFKKENIRILKRRDDVYVSKDSGQRTEKGDCGALISDFGFRIGDSFDLGIGNADFGLV
jgi:hypothetical protein